LTPPPPGGIVDTRRKNMYNHAFTIAFEVKSSNPHGEDLTGGELREALLRRVNELSDEEFVEACDAPFDSYYEPDGGERL